MNIKEFNNLSENEAIEALLKCCGSNKWAKKLVSMRPFDDRDTFFYTSFIVWTSTEEEDWKEAFSHHPKIGDLKSLEKKFFNSADWASKEQEAVNNASKKILVKLEEGNKMYEEKFGFIFIVCATGKTASEMLYMLERRLENPMEEELKIAMLEQAKITKLRLDKLFS